ncbi:hypothetical protein GJ744_011745 [Endocarpon pusillum]|uniref:Uncharacterized protein n=1 Tax=Endocarpon pusillum TaxID=364733 RepID=A0A8H7AJY3_9EURO|nr:hypothetical protein GJ744_011745 [Endocarpon pusillum]
MGKRCQVEMSVIEPISLSHCLQLPTPDRCASQPCTSLRNYRSADYSNPPIKRTMEHTTTTLITSSALLMLGFIFEMARMMR